MVTDNIVEGKYIPSHFFMYMDSNEDINKLIKNKDQAFVHEYIHFLQDLILPYCIRYNLTKLSRFSDVNIYALRKGEISRPFFEWNEDTKICFNQQIYTWGDTRYIENVTRIIKIEPEAFIMSDGKSVYKYLLDLGDIQYQVGARDFLEYIAHHIENKYWKTDAPDFPYKTIDKIFEYYGLSDIPVEVRLCIIEYCLYNDNPIRIFMHLFIQEKLIISKKTLFMDYNLCVNELSGMGWHSKGEFNESMLSKTQRRLKQLKDMLDAQYIHSQFTDIRLWIDKVIDFSEHYLSNKFIFSNLYTMKVDMFLANIDEVIKEIGIPLVLNRNMTCLCFIPNKYEIEQFVQFYILHRFMDNYIIGTEDACPIIDFCRANSTITDTECSISPLANLEVTELCPFKLFLKSYGFHKVKFIKNNV